MKIKIIKTYSDKYTGETVEAGNTIEKPKERAQELIKAGVAEPIKTAEKAAKTAK